MFIDTHCHLDAAEFEGQQAQLWQTAREAGVKCLVIPAVECASFCPVKQLCERMPDCFPAYGIHPMFTNSANPADLHHLQAFLRQNPAVAVGEIGLDFYIPDYNRSQQEYYLTKQLQLAREFDLPVLLHNRRAQDILLMHLRQIKVRGGIAHAFSGSRQQAFEFIKLGFKLGFGGAMTYPRATRLRELARTLPLSSIVLETDAPDMRPEFISQGLPNKPEYLPRIGQILAELRGVSSGEIEQITAENARAVLPGLIPSR